LDESTITVTETQKTALTTGGNSHRVPVRVKTVNERIKQYERIRTLFIELSFIVT